MKWLIIAILFVFLSGGMAAAQYDFPSNPTLDQVVTGPGGQQFKWDGVKWVAIFGPAGGGGGLTFVGPTPPPSPPVGQLWFDTTNVQTYLWYNDGTSSQWVAIVNIVGSGAFLPLAGGTMSGPINNVTALGIGTASSTSTGAMINIRNDGSYGVGGSVTNASTGTNAWAGWSFFNDTSVANNYIPYAAIQYNGSGYTAGGALSPPDALVITANNTGGISFVSNVNAQMTWWLPLSASQGGGSIPAASLQSQGGVGNQATGFNIGAEAGPESYAGYYTYNDAGHYSVFQLNSSNSTIAFPDSALIQTNATGSMDVYSLASDLMLYGNPKIIALADISIVHLENKQDYGAPSVIAGGSLVAGSRDSFGNIVSDGVWPVGLVFQRPFVGQAVCVATCAQGSGCTIFTGSPTTTSMNFGCYLQNGAACPAGVWFSYACFGMGG